MVVVWECELRNIDPLAERLKNERSTRVLQYPASQDSQRMAAEDDVEYVESSGDRGQE